MRLVVVVVACWPQKEGGSVGKVVDGFLSRALQACSYSGQLEQFEGHGGDEAHRETPPVAAAHIAPSSFKLAICGVHLTIPERATL